MPRNAKLKPFVFGGPGGGSLKSDAGLLVLRLWVGLVLSLTHGLAKLHDPAPFMKTTAALGFPLPKLFGSMAIFSEFAGGLLIAIGLATRPAAFLVAFTMGVAGFVALKGQAFQIKELAFAYLAVAILLMFTGAGRYSVDALIQPRRSGYR